MAHRRQTVVAGIERDLTFLPEVLAQSGLAASALTLAGAMDNPRNSATSKAMCAGQLRETMDRLRELAPPAEEDDWVDELAKRKQRHAAARRAAAEDVDSA